MKEQKNSYYGIWGDCFNDGKISSNLHVGVKEFREILNDHRT